MNWTKLSESLKKASESSSKTKSATEKAKESSVSNEVKEKPLTVRDGAIDTKILASKTIRSLEKKTGVAYDNRKEKELPKKKDGYLADQRQKEIKDNLQKEKEIGGRSTVATPKKEGGYLADQQDKDKFKEIGKKREEQFPTSNSFNKGYQKVVEDKYAESLKKEKEFIQKYEKPSSHVKEQALDLNAFGSSRELLAGKGINLPLASKHLDKTEELTKELIEGSITPEQFNKILSDEENRNPLQKIVEGTFTPNEVRQRKDGQPVHDKKDNWENLGQGLTRGTATSLAGLSGGASALGNYLSGEENFAGLGSAKDYYTDVYNRYQDLDKKELKSDTVSGAIAETLTDPRRLSSLVGEQIFNLATFVVGGLQGAKIATGVVNKVASNQNAIGGVARLIQNNPYLMGLAQGVGGSAVTTPAEAWIEAGNSYIQALQSNKDEDSAQKIALQVFNGNLAILGIANTLTIGAGFISKPLAKKVGELTATGISEVGKNTGRLGKHIQKTSGVLGKTAEIGKRGLMAGVSGTSEGTQEAYQEELSSSALLGTDMELNPLTLANKHKEAFASGFVMGGASNLFFNNDDEGTQPQQPIPSPPQPIPQQPTPPQPIPQQPQPQPVQPIPQQPQPQPVQPIPQPVQPTPQQPQPIPQPAPQPAPQTQQTQPQPTTSGVKERKSLNNFPSTPDIPKDTIQAIKDNNLSEEFEIINQSRVVSRFDTTTKPISSYSKIDEETLKRNITKDINTSLNKVDKSSRGDTLQEDLDDIDDWLKKTENLPQEEKEELELFFKLKREVLTEKLQPFLDKQMQDYEKERKRTENEQNILTNQLERFEDRVKQKSFKPLQSLRDNTKLINDPNAKQFDKDFSVGKLKIIEDHLMSYFKNNLEGNLKRKTMERLKDEATNYLGFISEENKEKFQGFIDELDKRMNPPRRQSRRQPQPTPQLATEENEESVKDKTEEEEAGETTGETTEETTGEVTEEKAGETTEEAKEETPEEAKEETTEEAKEETTEEKAGETTEETTESVNEETTESVNEETNEEEAEEKAGETTEEKTEEKTEETKEEKTEETKEKATSENTTKEKVKELSDKEIEEAIEKAFLDAKDIIVSTVELLKTTDFSKKSISNETVTNKLKDIKREEIVKSISSDRVKQKKIREDLVEKLDEFIFGVLSDMEMFIEGEPYDLVDFNMEATFYSGLDLLEKSKDIFGFDEDFQDTVDDFINQDIKNIDYSSKAKLLKDFYEKAISPLFKDEDLKAHYGNMNSIKDKEDLQTRITNFKKRKEQIRNLVAIIHQKNTRLNLTTLLPLEELRIRLFEETDLMVHYDEFMRYAKNLIKDEETTEGKKADINEVNSFYNVFKQLSVLKETLLELAPSGRRKKQKLLKKPKKVKIEPLWKEKFTIQEQLDNIYKDAMNDYQNSVGIHLAKVEWNDDKDRSINELYDKYLRPTFQGVSFSAGEIASIVIKNIVSEIKKPIIDSEVNKYEKIKKERKTKKEELLNVLNKFHSLFGNQTEKISRSFYEMGGKKVFVHKQKITNESQEDKDLKTEEVEVSLFSQFLKMTFDYINEIGKSEDGQTKRIVHHSELVDIRQTIKDAFENDKPLPSEVISNEKEKTKVGKTKAGETKVEETKAEETKVEETKAEVTVEERKQQLHKDFDRVLSQSDLDLIGKKSLKEISITGKRVLPLTLIVEEIIKESTHEVKKKKETLLNDSERIKSFDNLKEVTGRERPKKEESKKALEELIKLHEAKKVLQTTIDKTKNELAFAKDILLHSSILKEFFDSLVVEEDEQIIPIPIGFGSLLETEISFSQGKLPFASLIKRKIQRFNTKEKYKDLREILLEGFPLGLNEEKGHFAKLIEKVNATTFALLEINSKQIEQLMNQQSEDTPSNARESSTTNESDEGNIKPSEDEQNSSETEFSDSRIEEMKEENEKFEELLSQPIVFVDETHETHGESKGLFLLGEEKEFESKTDKKLGKIQERLSQLSKEKDELKNELKGYELEINYEKEKENSPNPREFKSFRDYVQESLRYLRSGGLTTNDNKGKFLVYKDKEQETKKPIYSFSIRGLKVLTGTETVEDKEKAIQEKTSQLEGFNKDSLTEEEKANKQGLRNEIDELKYEIDELNNLEKIINSKLDDSQLSLLNEEKESREALYERYKNFPPLSDYKEKTNQLTQLEKEELSLEESEKRLNKIVELESYRKGMIEDKNDFERDINEILKFLNKDSNNVPNMPLFADRLTNKPESERINEVNKIKKIVNNFFQALNSFIGTKEESVSDDLRMESLLKYNESKGNASTNFEFHLNNENSTTNEMFKGATKQSTVGMTNPYFLRFKKEIQEIVESNGYTEKEFASLLTRAKDDINNYISKMEKTLTDEMESNDPQTSFIKDFLYKHGYTLASIMYYADNELSNFEKALEKESPKAMQEINQSLQFLRPLASSSRNQSLMHSMIINYHKEAYKPINKLIKDVSFFATDMSDLLSNDDEKIAEIEGIRKQWLIKANASQSKPYDDFSRYLSKIQEDFLEFINDDSRLYSDPLLIAQTIKLIGRLIVSLRKLFKPYRDRITTKPTGVQTEEFVLDRNGIKIPLILHPKTKGLLSRIIESVASFFRNFRHTFKDLNIQTNANLTSRLVRAMGINQTSQEQLEGHLKYIYTDRKSGGKDSELTKEESDTLNSYVVLKDLYYDLGRQMINKEQNIKQPFDTIYSKQRLTERIPKSMKPYLLDDKGEIKIDKLKEALEEMENELGVVVRNRDEYNRDMFFEEDIEYNPKTEKARVVIDAYKRRHEVYVSLGKRLIADGKENHLDYIQLFNMHERRPYHLARLITYYLEPTQTKAKENRPEDETYLSILSLDKNRSNSDKDYITSLIEADAERIKRLVKVSEMLTLTNFVSSNNNVLSEDYKKEEHSESENYSVEKSWDTMFQENDMGTFTDKMLKQETKKDALEFKDLQGNPVSYREVRKLFKTLIQEYTRRLKNPTIHFTQSNELAVFLESEYDFISNLDQNIDDSNNPYLIRSDVELVMSLHPDSNKYFGATSLIELEENYWNNKLKSVNAKINPSVSTPENIHKLKEETVFRYELQELKRSFISQYPQLKNGENPIKNIFELNPFRSIERIENSLIMINLIVTKGKGKNRKNVSEAKAVPFAKAKELFYKLGEDKRKIEAKCLDSMVQFNSTTDANEQKRISKRITNLQRIISLYEMNILATEESIKNSELEEDLQLFKEITSKTYEKQMDNGKFSRNNTPYFLYNMLKKYSFLRTPQLTMRNFFLNKEWEETEIPSVDEKLLDGIEDFSEEYYSRIFNEKNFTDPPKEITLNMSDVNGREKVRTFRRYSIIKGTFISEASEKESLYSDNDLLRQKNGTIYATQEVVNAINSTKVVKNQALRIWGSVNKTLKAFLLIFPTKFAGYNIRNAFGDWDSSKWIGNQKLFKKKKNFAFVVLSSYIFSDTTPVSSKTDKLESFKKHAKLWSFVPVPLMKDIINNEATTIIDDLESQDPQRRHQAEREVLSYYQQFDKFSRMGGLNSTSIAQDTDTAISKTEELYKRHTDKSLSALDNPIDYELLAQFLEDEVGKNLLKGNLSGLTKKVIMLLGKKSVQGSLNFVKNSTSASYEFTKDSVLFYIKIARKITDLTALTFKFAGYLTILEESMESGTFKIKSYYASNKNQIDRLKKVKELGVKEEEVKAWTMANDIFNSYDYVSPSGRSLADYFPIPFWRYQETNLRKSINALLNIPHDYRANTNPTDSRIKKALKLIKVMWKYIWNHSQLKFHLLWIGTVNQMAMMLLNDDEDEEKLLLEEIYHDISAFWEDPENALAEMWNFVRVGALRYSSISDYSHLNIGNYTFDRLGNIDDKLEYLGLHDFVGDLLTDWFKEEGKKDTISKETYPQMLSKFVMMLHPTIQSWITFTMGTTPYPDVTNPQTVSSPMIEGTLNVVGMGKIARPVETFVSKNISDSVVPRTDNYVGALNQGAFSDNSDFLEKSEVILNNLVYHFHLGKIVNKYALSNVMLQDRRKEYNRMANISDPSVDEKNPMYKSLKGIRETVLSHHNKMSQYVFDVPIITEQDIANEKDITIKNGMIRERNKILKRVREDETFEVLGNNFDRLVKLMSNVEVNDMKSTLESALGIEMKEEVDSKEFKLDSILKKFKGIDAKELERIAKTTEFEKLVESSYLTTDNIGRVHESIRSSFSKFYDDSFLEMLVEMEKVISGNDIKSRYENPYDNARIYMEAKDKEQTEQTKRGVDYFHQTTYHGTGNRKVSNYMLYDTRKTYEEYKRLLLSETYPSPNGKEIKQIDQLLTVWKEYHPDNLYGKLTVNGNYLKNKDGMPIYYFKGENKKTVKTFNQQKNNERMIEEYKKKVFK